MTHTEDPPFLNVAQSINGRVWRARPSDDRLALGLAQKLAVPEIVGRLLNARGIDELEAPAFLEPKLRDALPDPSHLLDMDKAVERVVAALKANESICIFGDYDVDGATSAALLVRYLRQVGAPPRVYVPDRIAEGYGPNETALRTLAEEGVVVVITVDCGITAHAALQAGQDAGLDVVVVDHHVAEPALPAAVAVINPNRLDEDSPHKQLAAVGVTFLFLVALNRALREQGHLKSGEEPDLVALLDLVALGTVCDVVPLTGLNRAFVAQGLKVMARRENIGIAALADVANVADKPTTYHAGFVYGPRVNAGGRVGKASIGAQLLSTEDAGEARDLAAALDSYNQERRLIEADVQAEAIGRAEDMAERGDAVLLVDGQGWHPGVIGIVASRLVERFYRPVCVVGLDGELGKGSGRSISGVDLGAAIIAARQSDLLINGGGHKMAAGFTVKTEKIEALRSFLIDRLSDVVGEASSDRHLTIDGAITVDAASPEFLAELLQLAPFGVGNPEPRLVLNAARIAKADVVGVNHVRCHLAGDTGRRLKAIAFKALDGPLGEALLNTRGGRLHLAGKLRVDSWQGRNDVQFLIDDAAPASI